MRTVPARDMKRIQRAATETVSAKGAKICSKKPPGGGASEENAAKVATGSNKTANE